MDPLIGRVLLERYEVLQRIGSGGMGAVYVGRQGGVNRKVALKVLRSDLMSNDHVRQRFRREAEIIAKLSHPHTIQLIEYGETVEGLAVMVMELLVGQSLSERLKTGGPLDLEQTLRVGREVSASLAEAHLYGLVHRDLKPANIFLAEVGNTMHAKVLDFGIARLLDEEATRLTSTGQVFGTPRYMSPEQAMSTGDVDARSDLYSLGLILYECVVGQPPFVAQTSIQYLSAHTTMAPPKLRERAPDAPHALELLIDACLAKEAEHRPQSADIVAQALKQIERSVETGEPLMDLGLPQGADPTRQTLGPGTTPPGPTDRTSPADSTAPSPSKSRLGLVAGFVFLAAAGIAAAAWAFLPERTAPTVDAGVTIAANHVLDAGRTVDVASRDAGAVLAAVPDAGHERDGGASEPDASEVVVTKTKTKTKTKRKPRKNRRRPPPPPPDNDLTRFMEIDVPDEGPDPVKLAKRCKSSVFRGLASFKTSGCPAGCSIIIDNQCAGTTPTDERAMSPGKRSVTIVCDGKVKTKKMVRFSTDKTKTLTCG